VRWRHPRYGLIPPGRFIHAAEQTGLIVPIGDWVLEHAVLAAARWQAIPGSRPSVSVNVSARQIRSPGFVSAVRRHLDRARLPPDRLTLEITETLLLHDGEQVWNDLARLRDHGVRVAIDDFGTGYSSLSYLRQMPVDILKIDRSFVRDLATSRQQWAVVESIVHLAHRLDLQVVAEGIERPDERAALQQMGCPFGQGFLFARPLSAADAVRRLRPRATGATTDC
jgi:EAL domain-containing protein (putative c-di-GMP-specific phosphodiesterase class I)